ncbi:MAG: transcription antitermination factor NusB [Eubacteriales bacterium]|nr:transcription antitermination factor NusB [Eubacteriales bacterium]
MSRTKAREIALHLIFEMGFQQFEDENLNNRLDESIMASISGDIALYAGKLSDQQIRYIKSVVTGVAGQLDELDRTIEAYSKGWKLSRLSRMTTALLRLAIYEMRCVDDVPVGAAINEAVELAKEYDTEEAASFINGILGSVARAEFPDKAASAETVAAPEAEQPENTDA